MMSAIDTNSNILTICNQIYPTDPYDVKNKIDSISPLFQYHINRKLNLQLDLKLKTRSNSTNNLDQLVAYLCRSFDYLKYQTIDKKDSPVKISRKSVHFQLIEGKLYGYINTRHLCLRWFDS